jgi:hypothetical protein
MSHHTHRANPKLQKIEGWCICVTPDDCAAKPWRQSAHGCCVVVDVCSCGSKRLTETNHPHSNRGEWCMPEPEEAPVSRDHTLEVLSVNEHEVKVSTSADGRRTQSLDWPTLRLAASEDNAEDLRPKYQYVLQQAIALSEGRAAR